MRTLFLFLTSLLALSFPLARPKALPAQTGQPAITSPQAGQVLQGNIPITVNTSVEGFQSAALFFGYSDDPTQTWFLIQTSQSPLANGVMAQWDTTTITDGNYNLRLEVTDQDSKPFEAIVKGLRVRNYSAVETDTPAPATLTPTSEVRTTATLTPVPQTATPLPTNPAELTSSNILDSMGRGALVILAIFALIGLYIWIRNVAQKRE